MLPTKNVAEPRHEHLRNRGARVSSSPIYGQPIEITLTGIGLANRGANFLPTAAGSKVAQFRGLAVVLATLSKANIQLSNHRKLRGSVVNSIGLALSRYRIMRPLQDVP